jgi:CRP-like cAMP-binding protein
MIAQSSNRLLAALPADEYHRLMPELHSIHLQDGEPLPHCGAARVYFPERGFCSLRKVMPDGRAIEIASVGNEGMVGLSAMSGSADDVGRNTYVQIGNGSARFMLLGAVNRELAQPGTLRRLVDRFSRALLESIICSAACNGRHTAEHRCVRWLLSAQDRIGRSQFELTIQSLGLAVGLRKSKVAMVLKRLSKLDIAETAGGMITIVDRKALEHLACSCYRRMKRDRDEALPPATAHRAGGRANIVQLVPDIICPRCQSSANVPHESEHECILSIDAEMRVLVTRTAKLHALRKTLVDERLRAMRDYLAKAQTRFSS